MKSNKGIGNSSQHTEQGEGLKSEVKKLGYNAVCLSEND